MRYRIFLRIEMWCENNLCHPLLTFHSKHRKWHLTIPAAIINSRKNMIMKIYHNRLLNIFFSTIGNNNRQISAIFIINNSTLLYFVNYHYSFILIYKEVSAVPSPPTAIFYFYKKPSWSFNLANYLLDGELFLSYFIVPIFDSK